MHCPIFFVQPFVTGSDVCFDHALICSCDCACGWMNYILFALGKCWERKNTFFIAGIWFPGCASGFSTCHGCEWIQGQSQQASSISLVSSHCARVIAVISCSSHFKFHRTPPFTYAECIVSTMMPSLNALLSPVCKLLVESLENLCCCF